MRFYPVSTIQADYFAFVIQYRINQKINTDFAGRFFRTLAAQEESCILLRELIDLPEFASFQVMIIKYPLQTGTTRK